MVASCFHPRTVSGLLGEVQCDLLPLLESAFLSVHIVCKEGERLRIVCSLSSSGYHNHDRWRLLYHLHEALHETHSTCRPLTKDNRYVCKASLVSLALLSTPFNPIKKAPKARPPRAVVYSTSTVYTLAHLQGGL